MPPVGNRPEIVHYDSFWEPPYPEKKRGATKNLQKLKKSVKITQRSDRVLLNKIRT
jgi:hypothetical protein